MATYEIIIKNKSSGGARSSVAGSTSSSAKDKQQDTIAGVAVYGYAKKPVSYTHLDVYKRQG